MTEDRKYELGHERPGKLLIKYSSPAIVAMLVNSLYHLVDTIYIGHGVGTKALAGLTIAFPIMWLVMALAQMIGIGSASIISRALGSNQQDKADRTLNTSITLLILISIPLTIIGLIFLKTLLRLFGATETILPFATEYMSIIILGTAMFAFNVAVNHIVRSEGNARVAMNSMIIGAAINIVLDPIFIFGFKMGVSGAAIATVIAYIAVTFYLVHYLRSGKSLLKIKIISLKPDFSLLPEIFGIGLSSFVRMASGSILMVLLYNLIAHYGADVHIAIIGVGNRVMMFSLMPLIGILQGLQPIVGFNYGAKNMKRVREALRIALMTSTLISIGSFFLFMFFAKPILGIFSSDPVLINKGGPILRILAVTMPLVGIQMVGAGLFQIIGKIGPALFLSTSRELLFRIPLIILLPLQFRLLGIWIAMPLSDILATVVTVYWYLREIKIINHLELERPKLHPEKAV
jgi:putative MATE family efflux protein